MCRATGCSHAYQMFGAPQRLIVQPITDDFDALVICSGDTPCNQSYVRLRPHIPHSANSLGSFMAIGHAGTLEGLLTVSGVGIRWTIAVNMNRLAVRGRQIVEEDPLEG